MHIGKRVVKVATAIVGAIQITAKPQASIVGNMRCPFCTRVQQQTNARLALGIFGELKRQAEDADFLDTRGGIDIGIRCHGHGDIPGECLALANSA